MNMIGIVEDPLPAGYHVEVSDKGSPIKSATSAAGASLSQLNSPTLTGWGRGGTDVASPDHWEVYASVTTTLQEDKDRESSFGVLQSLWDHIEQSHPLAFEWL